MLTVCSERGGIKKTRKYKHCYCTFLRCSQMLVGGSFYIFCFTSGLMLATEEIPDSMENIPKTSHCVSHLTLFCVMEGIS